MVAFILFLATTLHQSAAAEPLNTASAAATELRDEAAPNDEVVVRGRRIRKTCQVIADNSAQSRIGRTKICLTSREWSQRRDEALALFEDMPRRNPRQGPSSTAGAAKPGMPHN